MDYREAKDFIRANFSDSSKVVELSRSIEPNTYLEVLSLIERYLPFDHGGTIVESSKRFLFAGCLSFDRWNVPTPYVLDSEMRGHFDRFLAALLRCDNNTANTSTFLAKSILWDLYALLDKRPLPDQQVTETLTSLEAKLNEIPVPLHLQALQGFSQVVSARLYPFVRD